MTGDELLPGFEDEVRREDLSQFFTSSDVAERIAAWTLRHHPRVRSILDPAAGRGALLLPFVKRNRAGQAPPFHLEGWDIDPRHVAALGELQGVAAHLHDLRTQEPDLWFDAVIENPPYHDGLDVDGVMAGLAVAPFVVALLRAVAFHGLDRWERLWRYVQVVREVKFRDRPRFGGQFTPKQDFVVVEVTRRRKPLGLGQTTSGHLVEWW